MPRKLTILDVYCSRCRALPDAPCRRPNGNPWNGFHQARWAALGDASFRLAIGCLELTITGANGLVSVNGLWLAAGDDELTMTSDEAAALADAIRSAAGAD